MKKKISQTAVHEAGHVVIGHILGIKHKSVTIEVEQHEFGLTAGYVRYYHRPAIFKVYIGEDTAPKRTVIRKIENFVKAYLAGPLSEGKFVGKHTQEQISGYKLDFENSARYAKNAFGDQGDKELIRLLNETENLVSQNWRKIKAFATILEKARTLNGTQLLNILNEL
ncbi:MAG: hypothetical protein JNL60_04350 [Bacteroidia bacterium]|nr:hypothetical protein [Bacteroidia bacterium]